MPSGLKALQKGSLQAVVAVYLRLLAVAPAKRRPNMMRVDLVLRGCSLMSFCFD
jgi:hypothetical protein